MAEGTPWCGTCGKPRTIKPLFGLQCLCPVAEWPISERMALGNLPSQPMGIPIIGSVLWKSALIPTELTPELLDRMTGEIMEGMGMVEDSVRPAIVQMVRAFIIHHWGGVNNKPDGA